MILLAVSMMQCHWDGHYWWQRLATPGVALGGVGGA